MSDVDPVARQRFVAEHPQAQEVERVAIGECDVVVLALPNSDIVDAVVLGPDGILDRLRAGSVLIDMGSSVPDRTRTIAAAAAARGVAVVDAPVSGGVARARRADLAIMVGAAPETLDTVRPLLEATGSTIVHVGDVGAGHAAKALNNLLSAVGLVAAAEVLLAGRKVGIDPATLLQVLNAGSGRNAATESKFAQHVLPDTFDSGFAATLMRKDIRIALDLAHGVGTPTAISDALGSVWSDAVENLGAGADQTEVVRYLEALTDTELR
ncbi:MAG TPA: NAD(P)-dependent oxidoreductase [Aldersonia sp.]